VAIFLLLTPDPGDRTVNLEKQPEIPAERSKEISLDILF
jgi:hypothetical protein